ncbi:TetR/AcrR family transcriptional regulator [Solimonas terrae]|uniref:TetR/AcrR family transcriptional regulator n=1 Tax=Solimonas terrae TaxID=1396819 RepID=A0A6M2BMP8_9GAMM|nr:helix-turn-helix domain-containing protein [Solimonas terrae]NGY03293.1 TetR/AcrR family transcriptional regulator [Solimonas terrae]
MQRNPRGRPRKYSDELLVEAALRVMGRDGYKALTIRALADELGITHSALYTYVGAVEDIEKMAVHRLTSQLPLPHSSSVPALRQELLAYLHAAQRLLRLHPGVVLSRPGSAASGIFREISDAWNRALLPHVPNQRTLHLALGALVGTVLLIVEGERLLEPDSAGKRRKSSTGKPSANAAMQPIADRWLDDLVDLVLPELSIAKKGRKPASSRSRK